jgi:hypothetical protein
LQLTWQKIDKNAYIFSSNSAKEQLEKFLNNAQATQNHINKYTRKNTVPNLFPVDQLRELKYWVNNKCIK